MLTQQRLTGPDRVVVSTAAGQIATFTLGAPTAALEGPMPRTFVEQRRSPTSDLFLPDVGSGWVRRTPDGANWNHRDEEASDFAVEASAGRHRLVSSRKICDGPTFAELGAPPVLDGDGYFATRRTSHQTILLIRGW